MTDDSKFIVSCKNKYADQKIQSPICNDKKISLEFRHISHHGYLFKGDKMDKKCVNHFDLNELSIFECE